MAPSRVVVEPFEAVVASVVANLKFYFWHFFLHITRSLWGWLDVLILVFSSLLANLAASASSTSWWWQSFFVTNFFKTLMNEKPFWQLIVKKEPNKNQTSSSLTCCRWVNLAASRQESMWQKVKVMAKNFRQIYYYLSLILAHGFADSFLAFYIQEPQQ